MSLYLGKLGRSMVQKAIASPNSWGRVGCFAGKILPKFLWKSSLTTTAYQLSSLVKPGDKIDITMGQVIRDNDVLMDVSSLFGDLGVGDMEITEKMCTPEGMASFLRWSVFYDLGKIKSVGKLAGISALANTLLDRVLSNFTVSGSIDPSEPGSKFELIPMFHSLDWSDESFIVGQIQTQVLQHPWLFSLPMFCLIYSALDIHKNEVLSSDVYKAFSRVTNTIAGIGIGGLFSHLCLFGTFNGVMDYFTVFYDDKFVSFNVGDLLSLTTFGVIQLKLWSTVWAVKKGVYVFYKRS